MKRLTLAVEALGVRHGGAATVLTDLLVSAAADHRFARIEVFSAPAAEHRFDFPASGKIRQLHFPLAQRNKLIRLWWMENRMPRALAQLGADVLVCLSGTGRGGGTPHVTLVQQSLPFSEEALSYLPLVDRVRFRLMGRAMQRSCASSRKVIVQTHTMKTTVGERFHLDANRIEVIPPAPRPLPVAAGPVPQLSAMRETAPGLRLLYVGNDSGYKNLAVLRSALPLLVRGLPGISLAVSLPAPATPEPHTIYLGYLQEDALAAAYSLASVLILPSLQETVGLPLIEAMQSGTPVVVADRPYAREICEDAAVYFDALDPEALASAVQTVLGSEERRKQLIAAGISITQRRLAERPWSRFLDCVAEAAS